jgi:hypothetical protein
MSSFTSPLIVSPLPDGRRWKLVKKFTYHVGSRYSRNIIKVPAGFVTDFASVPWGLWNIFPTTGRWTKAAVVHDFCYQSKCVSRAMADLIFKEAMGVLGVPRWKINLIYCGVRCWGWLGYSKNNLYSARQSVSVVPIESAGSVQQK